MIQLILDTGGYNVVLPESQKGGYIVEEKFLYEDLVMISGRMVREYRGKFWSVSYQYGYFNDTDMKRVIAACEKGIRSPISCTFRTQENTELITGIFAVTDFSRPKFMWSRIASENGEEKAIPVWADFSVSLREVKPHA